MLCGAGNDMNDRIAKGAEENRVWEIIAQKVRSPEEHHRIAGFLNLRPVGEIAKTLQKIEKKHANILADEAGNVGGFNRLRECHNFEKFSTCLRAEFSV